MKKILNKNTVLVLLVVVATFSFIYFGNKKTNEESSAPDVSENYDKMKISSVRIIERKTGVGPFDATSDMNGNDSSSTDGYIRTNDELTYKIEVDVALNLDNPDVSESTSPVGGTIKVKVTVPTDENGTPLFDWIPNVWMRNVHYENNRNVLYAEYKVTDQILAGGNLQLSFTLVTMKNPFVFDETNKPTFEVWMEGNKPDNPESAAESIIIKDEEELIITGVTKYNLFITKGDINVSSTRNNVKGQYINLISLLHLYNNNKDKGYAYPYDLSSMYAKMKVEYYYRNRAASSGDFIKLSDDLLDNIKLVTSNINWHEYSVNGYPDSGGNYLDNDHLIGAIGEYYSCGRSFTSGVLTTTYSGGMLSTTNSNFYNYLIPGCEGYGAVDIIFSNAIELFVPYINDGNTYDYRIKITFTDFGHNDTSYYEDEFLDDNSVYIEFTDYVSGLINANLRGYPNYSSSYTDSTYAVEGKTSALRSELEARDGPYYGGEKRLITFDSTKLKIAKKNGVYYQYAEDYNEITGRGTMKYGIYKNNPSVGLNTNALVNSTLIDNFDWYDSVEEAEEYGVVTACLWDNPSYRGNNVFSYVDVFIEPIATEENYNKVAIARHKVWVYGNNARTQVYNVYTNSGENYYVPTRYDDTYVTFITGGSPKEAGESIRINKGMVDVQDRYFGFDKGTYNVLDSKATMKITTQLETVYGIVEDGPDILYTTIYWEGNGVSLLPETCNYQPVSISSGYYNYVQWGVPTNTLGLYPDIVCEFNINPYAANNTRIYYIRKGTYLKSHTLYGINSGGWWKESFITNLSGSNTRKTPSKKVINKDNEFDVDGHMYNISEDILYNVKTIELLPKNGDARGSIIHGDYEIKIKTIESGVRVFYSTGNIDSIGIETDQSNNLHIRNVDLVNDSRWIEVFVDDVLPTNATAIATLTNQINVRNGKGFLYHVTTRNNDYGDVYYFGQYASSDNLVSNLFSTYKDVKVVNRRISGRVYLDKNRNSYRDSNDILLSNKQVKVYKSNGELLTTLTTDNDGYYMVDHLDSGAYYITYELDEHQSFVPYHNYSSSNIINPETGKSNDLTFSDEYENSTVYYDNQNIGVKYTDAKVTVHHYVTGTTTSVYDDQEIATFYSDSYTTSPVRSDELYEEYNSFYEYNGEHSGDNPSGSVLKDQYEVTYYYDKKPAVLIVQHYLKDSNVKISKDQIIGHFFGDNYSTNRVENDNYTPAGTSGDSTMGVITKETTTVIYFYEKKPATITVHYYIEGTTTSVHEDDILNRNYNDRYTTNYYDSSELDDDYKDIYEYKNSVGNTSGTVNDDNIEVIYYYSKKPAKLIVHHYVLGTTFKVHENEVFDKKLNDIYETSHKESDELYDSDYIYDSVVGRESGTMNSERIEVTYYYKLKTGNIIVHHIIDDTNTNLCPDETYSGNYKEKYNYDSCTELSDINYTFKEIKSNDSNSVIDNDKITGRISQDNTEVTYYYTYKPGQIVVHHFLSGTRERVADDVISDGKINQEYTSSAKTIEDYKLVKKPENVTLIYQEDTQELIYEYEKLKYKIDVRVIDGEGIVTGSEEVFYGDDAKNNVTITPSDGYEINSVIVNRKELTSLDIDGMRLPKFENVKEDILVEVKFAKKTQVVPITGKQSSLVYISSILFVIAIALITLFEFKKEKLHK